MLELVVNVSLEIQDVVAISSCARLSSKTSSKTQGLVPVALISSVSKLRVIRLKIKVLTRVRTERIVFDNMVKGQYIKDVGNFFLLLDTLTPLCLQF